MTDRVKEILQKAGVGLAADLAKASVHTHPTAKGDATESGWGKFLADHLPRRYEVTQGFVVDRLGRQSEQVDLMICDRQFTTVLFDDNAARYVPAESVYAAFEVKQTVSKDHVEAAQRKVASVRALHRTSVAIPHAGGTFAPKAPFPILGGLLATRSEWSPPFGDPCVAALSATAVGGHLDLVVGLEAGAVEVTYATGGEALLTRSEASVCLPWFFLTLVHRLQERGTVAAVDYLEYRNALSS
ncbi:MAG: DUF6602 domain-containing protein [Sandaracinaceae bacterium]